MKQIIILLVISFNFTLAQKKIDFEFDYAQFGYDSTHNFVEFYYSFNQASMKKVDDEDGKRIDGILKVEIEDSSSGEMLVNNQWKISHTIAENPEDPNQSLIGVIGFILPKGSLLCEVSGIDFNDTANVKNISDIITVRPIVGDEIGISDIQLAHKMVQGSENTNSIFYKNTYEVIPIPNLVFGMDQPVLFYYLELYQLNISGNESSELKLDQLIIDSRNQIVRTKSKSFSRIPESRVEVGSVVIADLPTDTYTIILTVVDSAMNTRVSSSKKFFVYNPDVIPEEPTASGDLSILGTTFGSMSEEELDDIFDKSRYIATSAEVEQYKKLNTEDGKRQFMNDFWKARDQFSESSRNQFYIEYIQRVETANARYTTLSRPGWKTDRGRIFLMYGEPTEIERYPSQIETRPYEIWQYTDIEGGVYFIFADILGFSDYSLVHSTKRGELRDDNWSRRIYVR